MYSEMKLEFGKVKSRFQVHTATQSLGLNLFNLIPT